MPWTIDYSEPQHPEVLDGFLLAVGKALCLANNFEAKCGNYLSIVAFTDALREGKPKDDAIALAKKAHTQHLGRIVKGLKASGDVRDDEAFVLDRARDSRNYIAHEGGNLAELFRAKPDRILRALAALYPHVLNIARGDNIVSTWAYEVSEREPAPRALQEEYVEMVTTWVFGGALTALRSARDDL